MQSGLEYIEETKKKAPAEKHAREDSSDSCPSVDNFNARKLESLFSAVIEPSPK